MNFAARYRTTFMLAMALVAGVMQAGEARAQSSGSLEWVPLNTGKANHIAVGANNRPWVLGYSEGIAPTEVYYWGEVGCTGCFSSNAWIPEGAVGMNLAVNLNGQPFVSDVNGVIWGEGVNVGWVESNVARPATGSTSWLLPYAPQSWAQMGPGNVASFAAGVANFIDYPSVNIVVGNPYVVNANDPYALFATNSFLGGGCGSRCADTGWVGEPDMPIYGQSGVVLSWGEDHSSGWTQDPGGATLFSYFTGYPNETLSPQNPWVANAEGELYVWNNQTGTWASVSTPGQVLSLTDHHILTRAGVTYAWTGDILGGGSAGWTEVLGPPAGVQMKEIAWSQEIGTGGLTVLGPSELWGIDVDGNIYTALTPEIPPRLP